MLDLIFPIIIAILSIVGLVLYIRVLIKLFKTKGILHGILGIICGLYTFVWGWLKHKDLKLTKVMAFWTGVIVVSILLQAFTLSAGFYSIYQQYRMAGMQQPPPSAVQKRPMRRPQGPASRSPEVPKPPVHVVSKSVPQPAKISPGNIPTPKVKIDFESEMEKIEAMIDQNDKNPDAYYDRGWLYSYKGDLKMAESDFSRAIQLNNDLENAYFNRGLVYVQMSKFDLAVKDFSRVIELNPKAGDAYCNRGNANYKMGRVELAIQDINIAIENTPKDGELYLNRGIVYEAKGEKMKARKDFERAAELGSRGGKEALKSLPAAPATSME